MGALLLAACSASDAGDTLLSQATAQVPDASSTTIVSTTQPPPAVEACDPSPFVPTVLPTRVAERPPTQNVPYDIFTILSGTSTSVWSQEDGAPVLAVVRGSLPPARWLETPEVVTIRGEDAALGQLPNGVWGIAWFEGPDRCDEYSIILYPPATAQEVRAIAESLVEGSRSP